MRPASAMFCSQAHTLQVLSEIELMALLCIMNQATLDLAVNVS